MILQEDSDLLHLQVKPSTVPEAGDGLFSKTSFLPGEILAEYRGRIISSEDCYHQKFLFEDKMVYIDSKYSVLGTSVAAKANDIVKFQPHLKGSKEWDQWVSAKQFPTHEGMKRNAQIKILPKCKMFLTATRPIQKGDEILVDYGFNYWLFFHQHGFSPR